LDNYFVIQSAGTRAYHLGERPHIGPQRVLKKNNIALDQEKRAEIVKYKTLSAYDYIIAMDSGQEDALKAYDNVYRLLTFAPPEAGSDVPDPYYDSHFDQVFELILSACKGLLAYIVQQEGF
jgi:protein-tyrosine phosphatase